MDLKMFNFVPKRYIFSFLGFLATTLSVALQSNLSLTIVYMLDRSKKSNFYEKASNECSLVEYVNDSADEQKPMGPEVFDWSPGLQGVLLGAEYYGMVFGYVPGGRLAEIYGGKFVIICSVLLASGFTAILPQAARTSEYAFIVCRFIVGLGTAPVFPILFYMLPRWIPVSSRSFHASLLFAGYGVGAFVSYIVTGALCSSEKFGGWPSVFYLGGLFGLLWSVIAGCLLHETPDVHPSISFNELNYIKKEMVISDSLKIASIPWRAIVTSVPFWALAFGYFGQFWILSFYSTSLPLYMGTILNLESKMNGVMSCLPNLTRAVFACLCGVLIDHVQSKTNWPIVYIRKGATLSNALCSCAGFICVIFAGCSPLLNTACFIFGGLLGDFLTFGVCLAAVDIAPNLTGTVSGILSSISTIPYFALPALIGFLTQDGRSIAQWKNVYYSTICVIAITTLVYVVFGTSEPQSWGVHTNLLSDKKKEKTNNDDKIPYLKLPD